jgi:hypothetical protein
MPDPEEQEKIADSIFIPVLEKVGETFREEIKRIQYETALKDTHATAINTRKMAFLLEEKYPQLSDNDVYEQSKQYCKKLYDQWRMLDFKGIQHTDVNRPVSIPLTEVFVLPDVLLGVPEYETLEREETPKEESTSGSPTNWIANPHSCT